MVHIAGLDEASVVRTPLMRAVADRAGFALPLNETLMVYGDHSTGKRVALEAMLATQPRTLVRVDVRPRMSSRDMVEALHREVIDAEVLSERDLQDDLVTALGDAERVVLVSSAHRLSAEAAGQLQWLHARQNAAWSLILLGNESTPKAVGRDTLLLASVAATVRAEPLKMEELQLVLPGMHLLLAGAPTELLVEIDARVCRGYIGRWARFLQVAIATRNAFTAAGKEAPTLSRPFARHVLGSMPSTFKKDPK